LTPLRLSWLPLLLGLAIAVPFGGLSVSRLTIRDGIVWRVPVVPQQRSPEGVVHWKATKGPKCIDGRDLAAATIADESSVDFLLRDRSRVRAELDSNCPTLDFYGGFYLLSDDDKVCARRDEIRNRMGGSCRIERFSQMVPAQGK
jgi:hypothetical protein